MIDAMELLAYCAIGLALARRIYANCVLGNDRSRYSDEPAGIDRFFWVLGALAAGVAWPLGIVYLAIVYRAPVSRHELDRREAELKARERTITDLERELGIGRNP